MDFWQKIKSDVRKGIKEGIGIVREGVTVVKTKAGELTDEGKRQLRIYELKTKVQREIAELGGKIYSLSSKMKNPMLDNKVKAVMTRIKKLEAQILKIENAKKKAAGRTAKKRLIAGKGATGRKAK
jgi:hypothetical protein